MRPLWAGRSSRGSRARNKRLAGSSSDTAREKPQTGEVVAVGVSDEVEVSTGMWWTWPSTPVRR